MPKCVHKDFVEDMIFAVEGSKDQFFQFLENTDPNSVGIFCQCGEYYIKFDRTQEYCPHCNMKPEANIRIETPALVDAHEILKGKVCTGKAKDEY